MERSGQHACGRCGCGGDGWRRDLHGVAHGGEAGFGDHERVAACMRRGDDKAAIAAGVCAGGNGAAGVDEVNLCSGNDGTGGVGHHTLHFRRRRCGGCSGLAGQCGCGNTQQKCQGKRAHEANSPKSENGGDGSWAVSFRVKKGVRTLDDAARGTGCRSAPYVTPEVCSKTHVLRAVGQIVRQLPQWILRPGAALALRKFSQGAEPLSSPRENRPARRAEWPRDCPARDRRCSRWTMRRRCARSAHRLRCRRS